MKNLSDVSKEDVSKELDHFINKLYSDISISIKKEKEKHGLTNEQIAPDKEKMLSHILNTNISKKHNPYLLPKPDYNKKHKEKALEKFENNVTNRIVKTLEFKSSYNLVWGGYTDDNEDTNGNKDTDGNEDYFNHLEDLFRIGIYYLYADNKSEKTKTSKKIISIIKDTLRVYLPYAKVRAKIDAKRHFNLPISDKDIKELSYLEQDAITYAFDSIYDAFSEKHLDYFKEKVTFKIDSAIPKFYKIHLPSVLQQYVEHQDFYLTSYKLMKYVYLQTYSPEYDDKFSAFTEEIETDELFKKTGNKLIQNIEQSQKLGNELIQIIEQSQKLNAEAHNIPNEVKILGRNHKAKIFSFEKKQTKKG